VTVTPEQWQATPEQWQAVRNALKDAGEQFANLVVTAPAERPATKDWSVAETVAHVMTAASLALFVAGGRPSGHPLAALRERIRSGNVDTVALFNEQALRLFPDRDPRAQAGRLLDHIDELLATTEDVDPETTVRWFGDASVPMAGVLAHLLNEVSVHAWDIARAADRGWTVPPEHAAMFLELFLFGVTRHGYGSLLDHGVAPPSRRVAVQFRSRYTRPATMVCEEGRVSLAQPDRRDDVRVRFDPATLVLMMFGRIGKARAVVTGKVSIGGPRPWLLPGFLAFMHLPGRVDPRVRTGAAPDLRPI
jgi:uncharacterized protein (TIGR03083 family)